MLVLVEEVDADPFSFSSLACGCCRVKSRNQRTRQTPRNEVAWTVLVAMATMTPLGNLAAATVTLRVVPAKGRAKGKAKGKTKGNEAKARIKGRKDSAAEKGINTGKAID
jgi:hypothetical protein